MSPSITKLSILRVFGCLIFQCLHPFNKNKLKARLTICNRLAYAPNQCGYLCLDMSTIKIITATHIVFNEHEFPFELTKSSNFPLTTSTSMHISTWLFATLFGTSFCPIMTNMYTASQVTSSPMRSSFSTLAITHELFSANMQPLSNMSFLTSVTFDVNLDLVIQNLNIHS